MSTDDATLYNICERVAEGESLTIIAPETGHTYGQMRRMIRNNDEAEKHYKQALEDRKEWVIERVLAEIRRVSLVDIRKLYDEHGCLLAVKDWPDEMGAAVASVKSTELFDGYGKDRESIGHTKEVKLWGKEKSWELIGKNLQLFTERVEVSGRVTLEDLIDQTVNGDDDK